MSSIRRSQALMTNLLYPAFLGTYLVSISLSINGLGGDRFQIGVFLLLYFALAFLESIILETKYSSWNFAVDLVEIALMTLAFVILGMNEPNLSRGVSTQFWSVLVVLFFLPFMSRVPTERNWMFDALCIAAMSVATLASWKLLEWASWAPLTSIHSLGSLIQRPDDFLLSTSDRAAHSLLWLLMLLYLIALAVDAKSSRNKPNDWLSKKRELSYVPWLLVPGALLALVAVVSTCARSDW